MKHWLVVVLCFGLAAPVFGQAADSARAKTTSARPQFNDYSLESAAALGCGCGVSLLPLAVAFGLSYDASWAGKDQTPAAVVGCIGLAVYAAGSASGANLVGNKTGWSGSYGWSLVLAEGTATVSVLAMRTRWGAIPGFLLAAFGPPVMAAVGYNINSKRRESRTGWEERLAPPSLTTRLAGTRESGAALEVDARLVSVRF